MDVRGRRDGVTVSTSTGRCVCVIQTVVAAFRFRLSRASSTADRDGSQPEKHRARFRTRRLGHRHRTSTRTCLTKDRETRRSRSLLQTRAQLDSLRVTLTTIDDQSPGPADPSVMQVDVDTLPPPQPSDTSLVVALFGWTLVPLPNSRDRRSTSASCAGAFGPSVSVPQTPSRSRASSVSQSVRNTPRPSTRTPDRTGSSISQLQLSASPLRPRLSFRTLGDMSISAAPASAKKSLSLVQCLLCQRRVGLWTFASQDDGQTASAPPDGASLSVSPSVAAARSNKVFDVVKEHRSYCPYVARSTIVPSLLLTAPASGSVSDDRDLVEGWRAVLMVVQRCGLGQRQHVARFVGNIAGEMRERDEGLGGVKTMVAGVKEKGVRLRLHDGLAAR